MKKIMIALAVVILMGAAVSTLERYTGVNLYNTYVGVTNAYCWYLIIKAFEEEKKKKAKKIAA